jgi:tRNA G18 (ribose-2'-O)-methylase SpoU
MTLATADDPRLGPYTRVGDAAWLREQSLFVAEGRLLVRRVLATGRYQVASVVVTPAARAALADDLAQAGEAVVECQPEVLRAVTGFNFHRGCLALVHRPLPPSLDALAAPAARLVGLEGVGNPDNVGGIFRNAAAFCAGGVLVGPHTADPFYRKALRTSMGAALDVPWTTADDWRTALARLRELGFTVAAFTPSEDARPLAELSARPPTRIVALFGSEGEGLSQATLAAADLRVRIPIVSTVDSLNVAVAAGIALHRLVPDGQEYGPGRGGSALDGRW